VFKKAVAASHFILSTFTLLFSFVAQAQLCTGSLGEPVVNITFGTAGAPDINFTPPSAYTYINDNCPDDGFYTIANSTSGCFGNAWHTIFSDHTGGGAFMLVNATFIPGDFFVTTVTGLCPNTTYEFASWIMNVLISPMGIKPDLTFTVETPAGVILNQFNTGGINATTAPEWKQYGFFFTTSPGNPTIVLRIRNNAPGGIGNDLGLDDITFRPCGPAIVTSVQGNGNSDTVNMCSDEQLDYTFDATVSPGFTLPVYQWQISSDSGKIWNDIAGATNLIFLRQPTSTGNFWYRLTVAESGNAAITNCRISSNIVIINVRPKPIVNAGADKTIIAGDSTLLNGSVLGEMPTYTWSPPQYLSSASLVTPTATPPNSILYRLSVVSAFGCTNEDEVMVNVVAGIFVPTAFTPDNNGKNDRWQIPYLDPSLNATITVYNRLGQIVYRVESGVVDWDGKLGGIEQPSGTYVYLITFKNKRPSMKGFVTIIR
jgi:gliding motility-associated-like protein